MLHPSYTDLMKVVNSEVEPGEEPVVNSRYSIVLATAKRARQLIDGAEPFVESKCPKPLSTAIEELYQSETKILTDEEAEELAIEVAKQRAEEARQRAEEERRKAEEEARKAAEEAMQQEEAESDSAVLTETKEEE